MAESIKLTDDKYIDATGVYDSTLNESQRTLNDEFHKSNAQVSLCDFSTYSTVGTKITLSQSASNFKFILFRCNANTQTGIGGISCCIFPSSYFVVGNQFQMIWYVGSNFNCIRIDSNSDTELEITARTGSDSGIRQVFGIY